MMMMMTFDETASLRCCPCDSDPMHVAWASGYHSTRQQDICQLDSVGRQMPLFVLRLHIRQMFRVLSALTYCLRLCRSLHLPFSISHLATDCLNHQKDAEG